MYGNRLPAVKEGTHLSKIIINDKDAMPKIILVSRTGSGRIFIGEMNDIMENKTVSCVKRNADFSNNCVLTAQLRHLEN